MHKTVVLQRARDQACDLIRAMILTGELEPESRLEEVPLSARLGVSRTPVREALTTLEAEGLVRSRAQRGYSVVRPDADMVRESYPVLSALETAALRASGASLRGAAPGLRKLNERMVRARSRSLQYTLDRAFHASLTDRCGNLRLLELLRIERGRAEIIDGAHRRGLANREGSHAEHANIVDALESGDVDRAALILDGHWRKGMEVVIGWLAESRRSL
jgi:DNA-binding GntR family transcriptional regulator